MLTSSGAWMVIYQESLAGVRLDNLHGFFASWPTPQSPETLLTVLENSDHVVLAIEEPSRDVVGFITALSDGVLSAYISFLEVLPTHQHRGIGSELARRMLLKLRHLYAVDLLCDSELQTFYQYVGMTPAPGMRIRRRERLSDGQRDRNTLAGSDAC